MQITGETGSALHAEIADMGASVLIHTTGGSLVVVPTDDLLALAAAAHSTRMARTQLDAAERIGSNQ